MSETLEFTKNLLGFYGSGVDDLLAPLVLSAEQYLKNAGVKAPAKPDNLPHATVRVGEITVTATVPGAAGNKYAIQIVTGDGDDIAVDITNNTITVTLPDEGSTTIEIASALSTLAEVTVTVTDDEPVTEPLSPIPFTGGESEAEDVYEREYALYKIAVATRVKILHDGDIKGSFERTLTGIIIQLKDYAGGEVI